MAGSTNSTDDDPVLRVVEASVEAQTKLMLAYMEQMRQQVTDQVTRAMYDEMGGEQFYVRKNRKSRAEERNDAIRKDCAPVSEGGGGLSLRAASNKHHLSKSRVSAILKEKPGGVLKKPISSKKDKNDAVRKKRKWCLKQGKQLICCAERLRRGRS